MLMQLGLQMHEADNYLVFLFQSVSLPPWSVLSLSSVCVLTSVCVPTGSEVSVFHADSRNTSFVKVN